MSRRIFVLSLEIWRHPRSIKIAKTLVRSGYKVKLWGIRKRFNKGPRLIRALLNYALALVEIAIIKADLYWVENVPDIIYIPLAIFRRKYVYDRRSPWYYSVKREIGGSFLPLIAKIFETVLMSKASYIVCASTSLAMEVEGLGKPVEVIPNYPEKKFSEYATRDVRKELGIPSQRKVLLYVGKLSRTEGVDLLVDVAGVIKDLDAELWIVGDGPLRTLVKRLVEESSGKVRWFGWVERREVPNYIIASDICIVPRHKTCYSIYYSHEGIHKISECLLLGKPVVACGISPSKYYLLSEPETFPKVIREVMLGNIKPPEPPKLTWEDFCEEKVLRIIWELTA